MKALKTLLLALALMACVAATVTALTSDSEDGADRTTVEYTKVLTSDESGTLTISTNGASFERDAKTKWSYLNADATWTDLTFGKNQASASFETGDWTYSLTKEKNGIYTLTMDTGLTEATTELHLRYTIVMKQDDRELSSMEIVVKISKTKDATTLPAEINNAFSFIVGTAISEEDGRIIPEDGEGNPISNDFNWFSFSLPDGISLTSDGYLSGVPKKASDDYIEYKVFAENANGEIAAFGIYIETKNGGLVQFWIHRGDMDSFNAPVGDADPKMTAVQYGDGVHLVISRDAPSMSGVVVSVVTNDEATNYRKELTPTENTEYLVYDLPTDILGAYGVMVDFGEDLGSARTLVYILPQIDLTVAGIGVGSS